MSKQKKGMHNSEKSHLLPYFYFPLSIFINILLQTPQVTPTLLHFDLFQFHDKLVVVTH